MSRTRQPGPFATFDLDAALAIVSRLCTDFGGSVLDVDFDGTEMRYVVGPGRYDVWVGPSSAEGLHAEFVVRER